MARQSTMIAEHHICSQGLLESKPIEVMVLSGEDALTHPIWRSAATPTLPTGRHCQSTDNAAPR